MIHRCDVRQQINLHGPHLQTVTDSITPLDELVAKIEYVLWVP